MNINESKTQLMLLSRRRREAELRDVDICVSGRSLDKHLVVKCLGVMIDSSLSWSDHVSCLRKKCFGVLASLHRFREVLPGKVKLYNCVVQPFYPI